jgi:hypothetical protein
MGRIIAWDLGSPNLRCLHRRADVMWHGHIKTLIRKKDINKGRGILK